MLRRLYPATLVVLIVAALAVSGCGAADDDSSDKFKGDQQQVAKVIEELETQAVKPGGRGAEDICTKLITDQLARKIAAQRRDQNCDERMQDSLNDIGLGGGQATLEVLKVTVDGDKAIASVKAETGDDEETSDYALARSGKSWRISAF